MFIIGKGKIMRGKVILWIILIIQLTACQSLTPSGNLDRRQADRDAEAALAQTPDVEPSDVAPTAPAASLQIGDSAPDFTLPDLTGQDVSLQDFRGKVVLLNFWASWCVPCRSETPALQRLYEKYQDQDFVVIGVSIDEETVEAVPDFIEEFGLTYPILLDTTRVSTGQDGSYRLEGIPQSYFIDAEGIIRDIGEGALEWDFMEGKALVLLDPEAGQRRMAALNLVTEGENLAGAGDIEGAALKFQEALSRDPSLERFDDPQAEAKRVAGLALVEQGESLARDGQIQEAIASYEQAWQIDPTLEIEADQWNNLCWFGSLWGQAADVLEACEQGVELAAPERRAGNRDSRAVARALTGDKAGAIEDFKVFVAWTKENDLYDRYGTKREAWIAELTAGRNPFDEETLEALRNE
jgi:peroxiredoxin